VILRLEHIGDETINNLTTKKVVCPHLIQNVGTFRKHHYQVFTQSFLEFWGVSIAKVASLLVNEDNVASLPNLKDMRQTKPPQIRHIIWHGKEFDLLNPEGVLLTKGRVMVSDRKEVILDEILRHDHVSLTILYCLGDILVVMTIWKWLLT